MYIRLLVSKGIRSIGQVVSTMVRSIGQLNQ